MIERGRTFGQSINSADPSAVKALHNTDPGKGLAVIQV